MKTEILGALPPEDKEEPAEAELLKPQLGLKTKVLGFKTEVLGASPSEGEEEPAEAEVLKTPLGVKTGFQD